MCPWPPLLAHTACAVGTCWLPLEAPTGQGSRTQYPHTQATSLKFPKITKHIDRAASGAVPPFQLYIVVSFLLF